MRVRVRMRTTAGSAAVAGAAGAAGGGAAGAGGSADAGEWRTIYMGSATGHEEGGLTPGETYAYRVRAEGGGRSCAWSDLVLVSTRTLAPTLTLTLALTLTLTLIQPIIHLRRATG